MTEIPAVAALLSHPRDQPALQELPQSHWWSPWCSSLQQEMKSSCPCPQPQHTSSAESVLIPKSCWLRVIQLSPGSISCWLTGRSHPCFTFLEFLSLSCGPQLPPGHGTDTNHLLNLQTPLCFTPWNHPPHWHPSHLPEPSITEYSELRGPTRIREPSSMLSAPCSEQHSQSQGHFLKHQKRGGNPSPALNYHQATARTSNRSLNLHVGNYFPMGYNSVGV